MNRKLNTAPVNTEQAYLTNDRPAILGGARMGPTELPAGFDLTLHKKILASGTIRATTHEEMMEIISKLEKQLAT